MGGVERRDGQEFWRSRLPSHRWGAQRGGKRGSVGKWHRIKELNAQLRAGHPTPVACSLEAKGDAVTLNIVSSLDSFNRATHLEFAERKRGGIVSEQAVGSGAGSGGQRALVTPSTEWHVSPTRTYKEWHEQKSGRVPPQVGERTILH